MSTEELHSDVADTITGFIIANRWRPPARIVTTVAELDALGVGAVVRDKLADAWTSIGRFWQVAGSDETLHSESISLPATVLWEGDTDA
jgi:hypothetical protein